jgi:hypothetical protein
MTHAIDSVPFPSCGSSTAVWNYVSFHVWLHFIAVVDPVRKLLVSMIPNKDSWIQLRSRPQVVYSSLPTFPLSRDFLSAAPYLRRAGGVSYRAASSFKYYFIIRKYLTENILCPRFEDQPENTVYGGDWYVLLEEPYETRKYNVWA